VARNHIFSDSVIPKLRRGAFHAFRDMMRDRYGAKLYIDGMLIKLSIELLTVGRRSAIRVVGPCERSFNVTFDNS
jgi:hypothetical protein